MATVEERIYCGEVSANLDIQWGPYASVEEAYSSVVGGLVKPSDITNLLGMAVGVKDTNTNVVTEYWFQPDDGNVVKLVPKHVEANPEVTGEVQTLEHIKIGETIYTAPQGPQGDPGTPGTNGTTPHIDETTGNWFVGETDTGVHAQGQQGVQGNPGSAGPANTLSIGTVEGGDTASATITGTSPSQTLNLVLPKGPQGDPGNDGTNGADGADAINPFKGWFNSVSDLPQSPVDNPFGSGDFAYVYDSTATKHYVYKWNESATPAAWEQALDANSNPIEVSANSTAFNTGELVAGLGINKNADGILDDDDKLPTSKAVKTELTNLSADVNGGISWLDSGIVINGDHLYYKTHTNSIGAAQSSGVETPCSCGMMTCAEGDQFKVFGSGNNDYIQLYAFTDDDGTVKEKPNQALNTRADGLVLVTPAGATRLYINFLGYDSSTDKLLKYSQTDGLVGRVTALESAMPNMTNYEQKPWLGKKIVVFGDSLSEYDDAYGSRWSDYAEAILGATIINCAIGGSKIRRRNAIIPYFSSSVTYAVGNKVFYKPSGGTMNLYQCIAAHSAGAWDTEHFANKFDEYTIYEVGDLCFYEGHLYECTTAHPAGDWNASHFTDRGAASNNISESTTYANVDIVSMVTAVCSSDNDRFATIRTANEFMTTHHIDGNDAIITRLEGIDWSEVDAVIVMGGANDYTSDYTSTKLGASGSTDVETTLGAINVILNTLCDKYKNIPIYFATDTVRWYDYATNIFKATKAYKVGDFVTYEHQTYGLGKFQCIAAHAAGVWNDAHFQYVRPAIDPITWCDVYYNGNPIFNTTDTYEVNDIVVYDPDGEGMRRYRCTTAHPAGEWDSTHFTLIGVAYSYTDFFNEMKAEWAKLHNPYIDLYNMLGWNKWNFSQFFPTGDATFGYDGTHPRLGFDRIGEMIARWMIANKNFA